MLEPDTTETAPTDAPRSTTADEPEHTAWTPRTLSDLIVGSRTATGKSHARSVLLARAFADGGDRA